MSRDFPHISDNEFPIIDTVDAYKYENKFDYSKYDKTQMTITVCSVPWDVGLIHVGNAQIGGLGNVVKFETKEDRDAWFDGLENKYTWQTKYREYHTSGYIEVPLPYEKAVLFNYVYVEYDKLPIDYADGGKDKFFFFIRQCESLAPSTCKIEILRDTWQTYIYDIDVTYMMLERGHAPMALTNASRYLQNPIENNSYLLAEDVNYGTTYVSKRANEAVLNGGEMWACICTSANLLESFGSFTDNTANTPDGRHLQDGQPSMFAYALPPDQLSDFFNGIENGVPQFFQTVKAVFFVKRDLVTITGTLSFIGFSLGVLQQKTANINLLELNTALFGYGEDYRELAKLYTYPYAYLEISDESGEVNQVRIEETTGDISLTVTTSLAYPWLALDGRLSGIGSGGNNVTFANVSSHTFNFDGAWFDHLHRWAIPTFAVNVAAATVYEYETYYDRQQRKLENRAALDNAMLSADTAKANADDSAETAHDNAIRNIGAAKTNADASAETTHENALLSADTAKTNADASTETTHDNAIRNIGTAKTNADESAEFAKQNAYNSAETAKVNADRSAEFAKQNAYNSAGTAKTNADNSADIAKGNADRSAEFAKQNAYNSANTDKGNTDRSALAAKTNTENIADASKENAYRNAQTAYDVATRNVSADEQNQADIRGTNTLNAQNARFYSANATAESNRINSSQTSWDNYIMAYQGAIAADTMMATFANNTVQSALGSAIQGAQAGAMAGGAIGGALGAAGGLMGTGMAAYFSSASNIIEITANQAGIDASSLTNERKTENANELSTYLTGNESDFREATVSLNNALNSSTASRNAQAGRDNATDNRTTARLNADKNHTTDYQNAERTYLATIDNATDSQTTAKTNADNTESAAKANASDTQRAAKDNAQNTESTAKTNADNDETVSKANAARTESTAKTNADNNETIAKANALRNYNADTTNADQTYGTALGNNERTLDAAVENADRVYNTAINNNLRDYNTDTANADQTFNTALGNNERAYETAAAIATTNFDTAEMGIVNDIRQAGLKAPYQFGDYANGDTSVTRPIGLFCNVVTQSRDAIEQAGDYFLRFGYAVNRNWKFTDFNVMPHFTYWKAADIWISGNNVPDAYLDEIRFFLLGGVSVWRNPEDIGNVSIYDN